MQSLNIHVQARVHQNIVLCKVVQKFKISRAAVCGWEGGWEGVYLVSYGRESGDVLGVAYRLLSPPTRRRQGQPSLIPSSVSCRLLSETVTTRGTCPQTPRRNFLRRTTFRRTRRYEDSRTRINLTC